MHASADSDKPIDWLRVMESRGFTAESIPLPTGRPDNATVLMRTRAGTRVAAKFCRERGGQAFDNMQRLWKSSFGERRSSPGLPQPLDYFPDPGVLVTEYIEGRPLAEAALLAAAEVREAVELIAALHGSDVQPDSRRSSRGIVRSARRKAERIAQLAPQYAETARAVADAIERARQGDSELCPSHGDFSPRNVLAAPKRLVLIDWDRLQLADPARDVAYFGISPWLAKLRRGRWPNRDLLDEVVGQYETLRPGASLRRQLPFHVAAGLMRIACSLVELWPRDAYLVPALTSLAARELERQ